MPLRNYELELRLAVSSSIGGPLWKSKLRLFLLQNKKNEAFKKYYFIKEHYMKNTCKIELKTGKNESGIETKNDLLSDWVPPIRKR